MTKVFVDQPWLNWGHLKQDKLDYPSAEINIAGQAHPSSYCLVSLRRVASKILERVLFLQVVESMDTNRLLHPNHHGFWSNHSLAMRILQCTPGRH